MWNWRITNVHIIIVIRILIQNTYWGTFSWRLTELQITIMRRDGQIWKGLLLDIFLPKSVTSNARHSGFFLLACMSLSLQQMNEPVKVPASIIRLNFLMLSLTSPVLKNENRKRNAHLQISRGHEQSLPGLY